MTEADFFSWDDTDIFQPSVVNESALHDLSELLTDAPSLLSQPLTASYAVTGHPRQAIITLEEAGYTLSSLRGRNDLSTFLWYLRDLKPSSRRAYIAFEYPATPNDLLNYSIG